MPLFTHITIPDLLLEEVIEHAREAAPIECCGLLAGHVAEGVGVVTMRYPIKNTARSTSEYATDPRGMFVAFRSMRERGIELLAIYHSHPASEPVPSRRDIESNTYGESAVHVIVGPVGARAEVRAWWLTETGSREAELHVTQI